MIKERLDAYRRKKRREEMTESIKNAFQTLLPWSRSRTIEDPSKEVPLLEAEPQENEKPSNNKRLQDAQDTESNCSDDNTAGSDCTMLTKVTYLLYFLLWAILYVIAIEFQFGAVYFVLSMLIFIWLNTHSRPKKKGELSAYSVFNPNCEAINGTLAAEQFEREIRFGIGSMH